MTIPDEFHGNRIEPRLGTTIRGKYLLTRLLGVGGMASVFEGVHRNGNRVAIKILHAPLSLDAAMRRRFRREGQLANLVDHVGAVRVLDDDVTADGCAFLVMPLLRGETLRARLEREGHPLGPRDVLVVAYALLDILAAAHRKTVVHRDIKPENIFITDDGEVRVLDFGIARLLEDSDSVSATRSGHAVGTPAFMAPEQALGRRRDVDARTDIWGVGATMFNCLSGAFVHAAETGGELVIHAATRKARSLRDALPSVDERVAAVVDRALAFGRAERWNGAREMQVAVASTYAELFEGAPIAGAKLEITRPVEETDQVRPLADPDIHSRVTEPGGEQANLVTPRASSSSAGLGVAVTRSLRLAGARPSRAPIIRTLVGAAALTVAAFGAVGFTRWRNNHEPPAPTAEAKGLQKHLAGATAAWLGARPEGVREEAYAALQLDDSSPQARLDLVRVTSRWPDDGERANFVRAQDAREALVEDDRAYLEALAPGMTVPADFPQQAARLEQLHARVPNALSVSLALSDAYIRTNRSDDAIRLLRPLAERAGAPALILAAYGDALAASDNIDEATARLEQCVSEYPAATSCLEQLSQIHLLEGRCADAERVARKTIAVNANLTDGYFKLASALDGERVSPAEVHKVLDTCAEHTALSVRSLYRARFDQEVAILEGRFRDALAIDAELWTATSHLPTDAEHFDYANRSMELKAELGLPKEAYKVLSDYTVARQPLQRDTYGGDNVMYLNAIAAYLDLLPWERWLPLRASRLAAHQDRDEMQDAQQRRWLEYFAIPVRDLDSAREAIAALPGNRPFPRRSDRWPLHDGAIGNALSLAGQTEAAARHFERAAASCMRLDNPIEYHRAVLAFGAHLERSNQPARACDAYSRILRAWAPNSGSVTAAAAGARAEAICSHVQTTQQ